MTFRHPAFAGRIGFARADITPPLTVYARNWGAAEHDRAESVHRPLTLSAMVITDDNSKPKLVLIEGDLSWWRGLETWHRFRDRLLASIGIPAQSLIFSLTHSHASPPLMQAPDSGLPGARELAEWVDDVRARAEQLVTTAASTAVDCLMEWHTGSCRLANNRDFPDPTTNGARSLCGFHPHAEGDSTLLVGRATDRGGALRAILVNYACHPTTLAFENRSLSPDFVGAMRATIEQHVTGASAFFLQGASGELAPRHQYTGDTSVANRHGEQLGHAVLATLADMEPPGAELAFEKTVESGAPLAVWQHRNRTSFPKQVSASTRLVSLPLKQWPTSRQLQAELERCNDRALRERITRRLAVRQALGNGETFALPVSLWRTGDILWVGSMAESYSLLQRSLRHRFPQFAVVCLNLVNGSIGYLPPAELYGSDLYQVWQTPFDRGALETVIGAIEVEIEEVLAADATK